MQMMSDDIQELTKALCAAQGEIENVENNKSGHNYKYANLAACLNAIKGPLKENGLCISQVIEPYPDMLMLSTLLMHTSGQWIKSSIFLPLSYNTNNNKMQGLGSMITYARRYALASIIGLTQEDNDASDHGKKDTKDKDVAKSAELLGKLKALCSKHNIEIKPFGDFHGLKSSDIQRMQDVIKNFDMYSEEYCNYLVTKANNHGD